MAEGLLPGERMLWTGQPSRVRVRLADVGVSLYELAALAVVAVISSGQCGHSRNSPGGLIK